MSSNYESMVAELQTGFPESNLLSINSANAARGEDVDAPLLRYGFRIGDLALLIPGGITTEVLDKPRVFPLPRAPRWLAGMTNMRGNVVPLFDIAELSNTKAATPAERRVLVLGHAAEAVAVYVDGLPQPLSSQDSVGDPPEQHPMLQPFTQQAFAEQGVIWFEFNYSDFFRHLATDGADQPRA